MKSTDQTQLKINSFKENRLAPKMMTSDLFTVIKYKDVTLWSIKYVQLYRRTISKSLKCYEYHKNKIIYKR